MIILKILIGLVAVKAVFGFHFPWEKCPCCHKPAREHVSKCTFITNKIKGEIMEKEYKFTAEDANHALTGE